ncbi:MAG: TrkH family potassium uptake protein [Ruminococcaceae bacterium]|nr:TrkH family potassium uptake protein [Oscillospiraceae bacterium]
MNYRMIGYLLGIILMIEAVLLLLPMLVALIYGESALPFLFTIAIILAVSLPLIIFKPKNIKIYTKDGFVCVASAWIVMSVFGALPFVFSGVIPNYIDALFETVSGFTTTGASIMTAIEGPSRMGILFWRSFTHWIGGMGVLVFMLALLPSTGGQAIYLMRAEVPGPTKDKLVPKMRQTALILYAIYFVLTLIMTAALMFCGMNIYHAFVNAFATAGTGGFSVLNNSIGGYNNPAAEWVIAIFMVIFGVNFNVYFFILIKRWREVLKNEELRTFLLIVAAATCVISVNIFMEMGGPIGERIRQAFFQVSTIISTTGFSTVDFNLWPSLSKTVLIILMVTGACAGSTAGGLKISRILILLKTMLREIRKILRPRSVNIIKLNGETVDVRTCHAATSYFAIYVVLIAMTTLLISIDDFGFESNLTAVLACINNIGPGFAEVGPMSNFSDFSYFSKILLTLNMLIGRLEIMPVIILLSPFAWKKH